MSFVSYLVFYFFLMYSIIFHEMAHAGVSYLLGDRRAAKRLTLNPLKHFDPAGLAVFLLSLFLLHVGFGWAKPVMIDPTTYKNPRKGVALVAIAGPATNLLLGLLFLTLFSQTHSQVFASLALSNNLLALFNLLPVPPLDGSRVVSYFFPAYELRLMRFWFGLSGIGKVVVIVLGFYFFQSWVILSAIHLTNLEFHLLFHS